MEGVFFKFSDLQFYLGVNYFYLKIYEKALSHFNLSLDLKKKVLKDLEKKRKKEPNNEGLEAAITADG